MKFGPLECYLHEMNVENLILYFTGNNLFLIRNEDLVNGNNILNDANVQNSIHRFI